MLIQIEIKNRVLSFCIGSLEAYTTNDKWENFILDRTKPENKDLPLRKYIKFIGLSFFELKDKEPNYILKPSILL